MHAHVCVPVMSYELCKYVRICENVRLQLGKQGVQCARVNVNLCEYSM